MDEKKKVAWSERPAVRWIANLIAVAAVAALAFLAYQRVIAGPRQAEGAEVMITATEIPTEEAAQSPRPSPRPGGEGKVELAALEASPEGETAQAFDEGGGISREINFDTLIPNRPRVDVITYTVQKGDTLFAIAESFGLKPETLLWGNFEVLKDNPNLLSPDMVLNVLPTNGVYYKWQEGNTLENVAAEFKTEPEKILDYAGNRFDLTQITEGTVTIKPGTWVIIPDGKRPIKDWGPPAITRANPAAARYYGAGSCGKVYEGAVGTGTFVWPTAYHGITQGYHGLHPAIDVGGSSGDAIMASDSGVVVFSGWSNFGYGTMIVIDHGNGFQTAYAHLSAAAVTCGQSVFQGGYIGAMGSTGNSTGPHLHFEISYNGAKPSPLDYLP